VAAGWSVRLGFWGAMRIVRALLYRAIFFSFGAACLFLIGCTAERQYRTDPQVQNYNPGATNHTRAIVEVTTNYTVGYVEFDDQGWLYGTNRFKTQMQIDTITNRFWEELNTNGLLIVTFVHGWKHNASGSDSNVAMFHQVLNHLGLMEPKLAVKQKRPARRVVGVYVGWRGLSATMEPFQELSFWDRKDTAEQVGHGAVIELLSTLEALRTQSNRQYGSGIAGGQRMSTKLIIVGHSFGGDIVYSAVAPILTERMVENYDADGNLQTPRTVGDLVVLINPAFEAARFETVQRLAATKSFPPGTNCTLAVFTSTADWATGLAFPAGRRLSTLFETYEKHIDQPRADITAVGHYQPYINYDLQSVGPSPRAKKAAAMTNDVPASVSAEQVVAVRKQVQASANRASVTTNDLTYAFSHCKLVARTNYVRNDPVFNVAVDPNIIPDHNTIDRPVFIRFLGEFLGVFASGGE
jgi:hypothetical protein